MNSILQENRRIKDSRVKVQGYKDYFKSNGKTSYVLYHFAPHRKINHFYRHDSDVMGRMRRASRRKQCRRDWEHIKPNRYVVYFKRSNDAKSSIDAPLHEKIFRERKNEQKRVQTRKPNKIS